MIRLDATWTELMLRYEDDHRDPRNQRCHALGIPLILAALPVALTAGALPGALLFGLGWLFQFIGHAYEGKRPSFVGDRRNLLVGALWWLRKVVPSSVQLHGGV